MLLFACGDPSQLSTDSSTQHNDSSENLFVASFRFNKISFRRGLTSPLKMSTKEVSNSYQNNNIKDKATKDSLKSKFALHSNAFKCELFDAKPISLTKKRTGSESKLPGLKKFWENDFIDSNYNNEQTFSTNHTLYGSNCAKSLPNLSIILSKDLKI